MAIAMDEAYLLGGWFASALWGAYSVLFGVSAYFILTSRKGEIYRLTTWIMVLMYSLATAHIFIALRRIVIALIDLQGKRPGPVAYLADIGDNLNRVKDLIYITNLVLGDCVITWRCYVIWAGDLRVVGLPILMIIGTTIAGYGSIGQYFLPKPSLKTAEAWGTAMFAVSLATNIIVTLMSAGRIWYLTRPRRTVLGSTDSRYRTIVLLLIESGAVIAAAKITEFVLFKQSPGTANGNHPLYVIFEMMPQITGMMPTLIIAIVNAGLTSTGVYVSNASSSTMRTPGAESGHIVFRVRRSLADFGRTTGGATGVSTDVRASRKSEGVEIADTESEAGAGGGVHLTLLGDKLHHKREDASFGSSAAGVWTNEGGDLDGERKKPS
ncbi:hypothetical protein M0805_008444 [Coniferiporia weirii]|nr:hypothetical protein M0805_008444 [Coniferiporia weirii]